MKYIFLSYAHEDRALCTTVKAHLDALENARVWVDTEGIRAGDRWAAEIDQALRQADLAVLLLSTEFLRSTFIREVEVPKLLSRQKRDGIRIVPFLLRSCAWQRQDWLKPLHVERFGNEALAALAGRGQEALDSALAEWTNRVADLLGLGLPGSLVAKRLDADDDHPAATELLERTLFRYLGSESTLAARKTAVRLARVTEGSAVNVFDAARFYVEFCLLGSDVTHSVIPEAPGDEIGSVRSTRFLTELRKRQRTGLPGDAITLSPNFFARARERESDWKNYFEVLTSPSVANLEAANVSTVCRLKTIGFIAAQHLVAGLLSRFDDDWEPVLNAYASAIPPEKVSLGVFESVQASQWNCWLVWGPSIPFCTCPMWEGTCAFQYGYGDENNSLPAIELPSDDTESVLDKLAHQSRVNGRQAQVTSLIGRLRWAPFSMTESRSTPESQESAGPFVEWAAAERSEVVGAPAQRGLYSADSHPEHRMDGLLFQFEQLFKPPGILQDPANFPSYFSAYRWVIFLVALKTSEDPAIGPSLLFGKKYPPWPSDQGSRQAVRDARLWEDLLPVFVHANIADPPALRFQRETLAESSLSLLRQVWNDRHSLFHKSDVARGIAFYMVCSFDYSGCGCRLRYPPQESLASALRSRLERDADREFAESVVLPLATETPERRPEGLRGYFSACHLPELISDYYQCVPKDKTRRPTRRTRA